MKEIFIFALTLILAVFIGNVGSNLFTSNDEFSGSSQVARVIETSTVVIGPSNKSLVSANVGCAGRLISTPTTTWIAFSGTASTTFGHYLTASSTTNWPAEWYGCGAISAHTAASTTIIVTEFAY